MAKGKKSKKTTQTAVLLRSETGPTASSTTSNRNGLHVALEGLKLDPTELVIDGNGTLFSRQEELSPRLLALQQQLERLDQDRYLLQRATTTDDPSPLTTLNTSAAKTELSLQSLKKRLSEVRQQLYGAGTTCSPTPPSPTTNTASLANLAKNYFGGMIGGKRSALGFPGEGEAFDEGCDLENSEREDVTVGHDDEDDIDIDVDVDEFEFEVSESEYYEDDLLTDNGGEMTVTTDRLLDATRLGLRLFGRETESSTIANVQSNVHDNLIGRIELELQAALDAATAKVLPPERRVEVMKERFDAVLRDCRHQNCRIQKVARLAHDERVQRQLIELELDKANAIKHRLESLCRDLHNENRRIKAEGARREEAAAKATTTNNQNDRESLKSMATAFVLPTGRLDKESLLKEPTINLADRIISLAELYRIRELHYTNILRQSETDFLNTSEKADMLANQLAKQTVALDASTRRVSALARSEQELKAQVRQYVDKFRQVEETLGKSNDLFGTFRAEMEQMGAKLARLERENAQLNSKCATLSRNIIEMADERTKQNASMDTLKGQKAKLEQLCRTLQAERNAALRSTTTTSATTTALPSEEVKSTTVAQ